MASSLFKVIAGSLPNLKNELKQANLMYEPEEFVQRSFMSALMLSFGISILFLGGVFHHFEIPVTFAFAIFPFLTGFMFAYFLKAASVNIKKRRDEINKEIAFATRFLIVEIESGVPIYDSFINISKAYPAIGSYFKIIVESVNLGTPMEDAINEILEVNPSPNFRKVLWQILNTLNTGGDVTKPLNTVLDQILKDQKIELEEYGRKLNPLAMFYMMIAVIIPSLGTAMLIIFSSFTDFFNPDLVMLLAIACFVGFIQFMFYAMIKSMRPAVEF